MTDQIPFDLLLFIAMHGLPCLLQCDGAGRVHRRIYAPGCPLPPDVRDADGLDACLSRSVREAWIDFIRESMSLNRVLETRVVLDGRLFDLACMPQSDDPAAPRAWLVLFPATDKPARMHPDAHRSLRHHEWGHLEALSRCQLDALRSITQGLSNQQIADRTHRSKRAVEWHIRHLHRLLGVGTRESLARLGRASGVDRFDDQEWSDVLGTRPARRTLEEFAVPDSSRVA